MKKNLSKEKSVSSSNLMNEEETKQKSDLSRVRNKMLANLGFVNGKERSPLGIPQEILEDAEMR